MFKPSRIAVALAAAGIAVSAQADDAYELDKVVVTAARTAQTVDQALAPVTVITRGEIERSQASSVTELLNRTPGMQIADSGGAGSAASVYLRGTKTAQTMILVDGHKINSANGNIAPLHYLDPDQIQRIEIVRGPKSSLYGADAMGGVIQIFTREGKGKPQLQLRAGAGSRGTGEYGLNYSGEVDGTRFNFGAKLYETRGYDHTFSKIGTDADNDAYRNKSVTGSISRVFENNLEAGVMFSHTQGKAEYDHNFGTPETRPYNDFKVTNVSTFVSAPVTEIWDTKLNLGYSGEDAYRMEEGTEGAHQASFAESQRFSVSWQNDVLWYEGQLLTSGLDYADDKVKSSSNYAKNSRNNLGVFAQNLSEFEGSELQVGGRYDKNEVYGENVTGNIAWGFDLPYNMRLTPSYGTAFRAPTFLDLYGFGGDPNLKAEKSENIEFELRGRHASVDWSINAYQNRMTDMLEWNGTGMMNIDEARIRGLELEASTELYGWHINTNATFLDPENRSGINAGKTLMRRATQLFTLNTDRVVGDWTLGGTLRAQNKTWNDAANTDRVGGFATFDLRAGYQFNPQLRTELKVVNLLDKEYSTTRGYRAEPRGVFATFIWSPKF